MCFTFMEGTHMVAPAPLLASPRSLSLTLPTATFSAPLFVDPARAAVVTPCPDTAVKLLDLLTNRYSAGLVRTAGLFRMEIEIPLTSHLHVGRRVRFAVAGDGLLVSKQTMRSAQITGVRPEGGRLHVELTLLDEAVAA
jgi:hypothetical protein